jgi:hypothetical protein
MQSEFVVQLARHTRRLPSLTQVLCAGHTAVSSHARVQISIFAQYPPLRLLQSLSARQAAPGTVAPGQAASSTSKSIFLTWPP